MQFHWTADTKQLCPSCKSIILTAYLSPKMVPALPLFSSCPFFSTARWNLQQNQQQQEAFVIVS
jgi:hypothetical protein